MLNSKWKIIFVVSATILVILYLVNLLLVENQDQRKPSVEPTLVASPTGIRPTRTPTPTTPPGVTRPFTGEKEPDISNEEIEAINQAFELRKMLPLETEAFSIDYDYEILKFIVVIEDPFGENRVEFDSWIEQSGFGAIPAEKFIIRRDEGDE